MKSEKIYHLVLTAVSAALIAVGAWLKIPTLYVAITLQLPIVIILGLLLGPRIAGRATLIYLLMGLLGLPVFAGGGGPQYLLQPSFGYIYGFFFAVYLAGKWLSWEPEQSLQKDWTMSLLMTGIVYLSGLLHLYLINHLVLGNALSLWQVLAIGFSKTIVKDLILNSVIVLALKPLRRALRTLNAPYEKRRVKECA